MAFHETRLFEGVRLGFTSGPRWNTEIVRMESGAEKRNRNWSRPLLEYTVPYTNVSEADYDLILGAHYVCGGMADGFRFKDWDDYSVTAQVIGVAPAGSTPVQLVKTYGFGAGTHTRTISKPVSGTVTVYSNGVAKTGTLDTTTGIFTPSTAWTGGHTITWTGEFDVPVRFDTDSLPATWDNYRVRSLNIPLVELKL